MTGKRAFELVAVNVHYGRARALADVDLQVAEAEVVAVLGDNGAGKSTLLKVMSGAHRVTTGRIRAHGVEVEFRSPRDASAAGVQMVYQDLALVDAMDIAANLSLGREQVVRGPLRWLGVLDRRGMRKQAQAELDALGVRTAPVSRPVELLSGGQRQVIAIARAAARLGDRGVLLLDEPTAALGHEQTGHVEDLIRALAAKGTAIVVVTHNLPLAMRVSDRVVVLNRGRKVADLATSLADKDRVVGWITGAAVHGE